ncbi:hypothetical protein ACFQ5J_01445 [Lacticaseibacillus baoqingensis]|uniref:LPXTG cell wall anchor domain-containing protein n=1 Tax=Lacticaseibacillus baoqingensis TaxID=2486013 RepID=A0ABW4E464_9LACO|nr:hypothetical protein [Lacticaseibacillus baoqingensis]
MTTALNLYVSGAGGTVAPGQLLPPEAAALPALGAASDHWLIGYGLLLLVLIIAGLTRRHRQWLRRLAWLLGLSALGMVAAPQAVHAASLPDLNYAQVSQWRPNRYAQTPPGDYDHIGFTPATHSGGSMTVKANTPLDLTATYHRTMLQDLWQDVKFELIIWRVAPQTPYQAQEVYREAHTAQLGGFQYDIPIGFHFTPTIGGVYFFQYYSANHAVATAPTRLMVTQTAEQLTIQAPDVIFPTTGALPDAQARAIFTPADATATVSWRILLNRIKLSQAQGDVIGLHASIPTLINQSPTTPGLNDTLSATGAGIPQAKTIAVGGLAAISTTMAAIPATGLTHSTQGLTAAAANYPPATWEYHWHLYPSTRLGNGQLVRDENGKQTLNAYAGVINAAGETNTLSDQAVAFTLTKPGSLLQKLTQATANGTPMILQLELKAIIAGHEATITSNYASVAIAPDPGSLNLESVPETLHWQMTSLDVYDHTPQALQPDQPLTITDTHDQPHWTLSARLHSDQAFPFALRINQTPLPLNGPAQVLTSMTVAEYQQRPQLLLTPTAATAAGDYHAAIEWTLAANVPADALP